MKVFSFKNIRILILLGLLAYAYHYSQEQKRSATYWYKPINAIIFPINGDQNPNTSNYINSLDIKDFEGIDAFFSRSAQQYELITHQPIQVQLGTAVTELPPTPPAGNSSTLAVMWWSLKLRWWAYQNTPDDISNTDRIRLYVIYQQGDGHHALAHSLGLQKGMIGVINAYADHQQDRQNEIVIAHEILHTVGATDKYDADNQPIYPVGYIEPDKQPLWPQRYAEIMAGRTAISEYEANMPLTLKTVKVGETTAKEINWIK